MKTVIISDINHLNIAADVIQKGGLVAAPTETVYGLCANALNPASVRSIFEAKGRPNDNPLIVHIANQNMLHDLVSSVPDEALLLMKAFWPGPLTLIFKASSLIPKEVTAGLDTVAIRLPSHPVMQKLINLSGVPLAAPSANTSGKPSPTNAQRVIEDLDGKVDVIIDGGASSVGVESTVLDMTSSIPVILRPGGITYEMLQAVLKTVTMDPAISHTLSAELLPKAPGMKYTHYSPNADVFIVQGQLESVTIKIAELIQLSKSVGKTTGVLATDETCHLFDADLVLNAGPRTDLNIIASNLFEKLREFDDAHIDIVYSLAFPKEGIGYAVMNRLEKSASYHIIEV